MSAVRHLPRRPSYMCDPNFEEGHEQDPRARDIAEAQRSLELRKVFAPERINHDESDPYIKSVLNADGALDAYAEAVLWRLGVAHCMISFIDRGQQYFIAGALRRNTDSDTDDDEEGSGIIAQQQWFGCSSVPTSGGLCENTLALEKSREDHPCFIVEDLKEDPRFKDLAVVDGRVATYRFYAGTPITSENGTNIGSFFLFDNKPRDGLNKGQRRFLHQQSINVMRYMVMKREADERRRAANMSRGISKFLDNSSHHRDHADSESFDQTDDSSPDREIDTDSENDASPAITTKSKHRKTSGKPSTLEQIRSTLNEAARILRESLDVTSGGVVFLDTALANSEVEKFALDNKNIQSKQDDSEPPSASSRPDFKRRDSSNQSNIGYHLSQGLTRSAEDKHNKPKVIAASIPDSSAWNPKAQSLNPKILATLIRNYGKGNVWSIDGEGFFSSWRQISQWEDDGVRTAAARIATLSPEDGDKGRLEASIMLEIFPKARQIVFLPLWDTAGNRWYAGCFIWTQSPVPVFTVESELTYLSAFTNSMMVEISRLDAVTANKMKSDFIGSISHEFRSPLHGILVSAEFLRDSPLDHTQTQLVATIQNCSGTLLDTINHVLDYSKINSFQVVDDQEGQATNQLLQVNNLAVLCESVIDGMVTANIFRAPLDSAPPSSLSESSLIGGRRNSIRNGLPPEIILNFEYRDWKYKIQSGAIQRVIMNLLGNAQKFTESGFISVQLKVLEDESIAGDPAQPVLSLRIKDSGRGMSKEFMERKLYLPFAQEDSFVPGVGLGLSIVWSIVNQLKGKIKMRSEPGKGTDVEVTLPLEKLVDPSSTDPLTVEMSHLPDNEFLMAKLRERAAGRSVCFREKKMSSRPSHKNLLWKCLQKYFTEWFGFVINEENPNIIVTDQRDIDLTANASRTLCILDDWEWEQNDAPGGNGLTFLYCPVGPYKLARAVMGLLDQDVFDSISTGLGATIQTSDAGTQTPIGSPEERSMLSGMIMTDYGFSTPATSYTSSKPSQTPGATSQDKYMDVTVENKTSSNLSLPSASKLTLTLPVRKPPRQPTPTLSMNLDQVAELPPQDLPQAIPLPESPTEKTLAIGSAHTRTPSKSLKPSLRVLAVDDNNLNLQLLHRFLLKRQQDVVVTATNGLEALESVQKANEPFDVVFMDISMPVMDGFEATRRIRSFERSQHLRGSATTATQTSASAGSTEAAGDSEASKSEQTETQPGTQTSDGIEQLEKSKNKQGKTFVVALTGLASQRDRSVAEECGFDDFLTKPISFKRIGELLDRLSWEK